MGLGIPIVDTIIGAAEKAADKIWMDKDKKEQLKFDREKFTGEMEKAIKQMNIDGDLAKLEAVFKESDAQRQYALSQFGTAALLKDFFFGKIILLGRAGIRWVITGFAMWQAHRLVTYVLTEKTIAALAAGTLSASAVWIIGLIVAMILGIPLFYVTGISVEKLFKARGLL